LNEGRVPGHAQDTRRVSEVAALPLSWPKTGVGFSPPVAFVCLISPSSKNIDRESKTATCTGDKRRSCLCSRRSSQTRDDGVLAPRIRPLLQQKIPAATCALQNSFFFFALGLLLRNSIGATAAKKHQHIFYRNGEPRQER
jgi:hypothetical protein